MATFTGSPFTGTINGTKLADTFLGETTGTTTSYGATNARIDAGNGRDSITLKGKAGTSGAGTNIGYGANNSIINAGADNDTIIISGTSADATGSTRTQWNLASDFRRSPNQTNPNPDAYGNTNVWSFLESTTALHQPGSYRQLPEFIPDAYNIVGLQQWQDPANWYPKDKLPSIGLNTTDTTQSPLSFTWTNGTIRLHPYAPQAAIVGWKSPITGTIDITGWFSDIDPNGGNGVLWFVDQGSNTIASGTINGDSDTFSLTNISVNQGDSIYFIVDANGSDFYCDSTQTSITITGQINSKSEGIGVYKSSVSGEGGNDVINISGTNFGIKDGLISGDAGDDTLTVGTGQGIVDGGLGKDSLIINYFKLASNNKPTNVNVKAGALGAILISGATDNLGNSLNASGNSNAWTQMIKGIEQFVVNGTVYTASQFVKTFG